MTILVRQCETGLYLTQEAQWALLEKDAFAFQSFTHVLAHCNLHRITGCEIHYLFSNSDYSFAIDWNPKSFPPQSI